MPRDPEAHRKAARKYQKKKREAGLCTRCGKRKIDTKHECIQCAQGRSNRKLNPVNTSAISARNAREQMDMTRPELAKELGISHKTVALKETSNLQVNRLYAYAIIGLQLIEKNKLK